MLMVELKTTNKIVTRIVRTKGIDCWATKSLNDKVLSKIKSRLNNILKKSGWLPIKIEVAKRKEFYFPNRMHYLIYSDCIYLGKRRIRSKKLTPLRHQFISQPNMYFQEAK